MSREDTFAPPRSVVPVLRESVELWPAGCAPDGRGPGEPRGRHRVSPNTWDKRRAFSQAHDRRVDPALPSLDQFLRCACAWSLSKAMLLAFLVFGLILLLVGLGAWLQTGLPGSRIVSADVGPALPATKPMVSHRYELTGKPDYLVQVAGGIAPVELKSGNVPRTGRPYDGNAMQLAAYCLLVEDTMQVSVPYGIIKYRDGSIHVPFTNAIRHKLLSLMPQIQAAKGELADCHRSHRQRARCAKCGYRPVCSEALN